jgi:hypothetical protein
MLWPTGNGLCQIKAFLTQVANKCFRIVVSNVVWISLTKLTWETIMLLSLWPLCLLPKSVTQSKMKPVWQVMTSHFYNATCLSLLPSQQSCIRARRFKQSLWNTNMNFKSFFSLLQAYVEHMEIKAIVGRDKDKFSVSHFFFSKVWHITYTLGILYLADKVTKYSDIHWHKS